MQVSDYSQVIGIILGMGLMGYVGDMIGRKWGSVTTACVMFVGGILLTCLDGVNENGLAIMYIVAQFVFGFGVGGEYPMAAGSAAERAEAGGKAKASKRGREVLLTFSMQVWPCSSAPPHSLVITQIQCNTLGGCIKGIH